MSKINTCTYILPSVLVLILNSLTCKEYKVNCSFSFAKGMVEQDSEFSTGSLDFNSLFTIIPHEETIDTCTNKLFANTGRVKVYP